MTAQPPKIDTDFRCRFWEAEASRDDDARDEYQRDKARIIHSAAFRRLQAKTQTMGIGESDFHRTRLTHSIEVAQIGEGIVSSLRRKYSESTEIGQWLPSQDLIAAACYAHDLGHPPFGHGGERALHRKMLEHGGFEGNGQTLRILARLEKYREFKGTNPTRRLMLAVLKYPAKFTDFDKQNFLDHPPKCYLDTENDIVDWLLLAPFTPHEVSVFRNGRKSNGKPSHHTFDCSIMECADDIAYGVHDLEDVVARDMADKAAVLGKIREAFDKCGSVISFGKSSITIDDFEKKLYGRSYDRKEFIGKLVNLFISSIDVSQRAGLSHPLMRYQASFSEETGVLLEALKGVTSKLVIKQAKVQQLEYRGERIVEKLFDALSSSPETLIPQKAWLSLNPKDGDQRKVCDYIAGMTDPYAQKIYQRLFVPGFGSSHDEL